MHLCYCLETIAAPYSFLKKMTMINGYFHFKEKTTYVGDQRDFVTLKYMIEIYFEHAKENMKYHTEISDVRQNRKHNKIHE